MSLPDPGIKSLSREDFPEQADWIDPLLRSVNGTADAVAGTVATLNAQSATAFVDLDIPGTYADAFPKLIANPLPGKAVHVYATGVIKRTDPSGTATAQTRAVFVEWENSATGEGTRQLKIKNVAGLEVSTNYRVTLKVEL